MCSAPPAGTVIFFAWSAGSAMRMPPGGGLRLPWKSLTARMPSLTGAGDWADAGVLASASTANARQDEDFIAPL